MAFNFNIRNIFKSGESRSVIPQTYALPLFGGAMWCGDAMNHPTVQLAIALISDSIAKSGFSIYKVNPDGTETLMEDSAIEHPNKRHSQYNIVKLVITQLLTVGSAFLYTPHDEKGNIKSIHYIPNNLVTVGVPQNYLDDDYTFNISGLKDVKANDVMYFGAIPTSDNPDQFVSPTMLCQQALKLAAQAEKTAKRWTNTQGGIFGILKSQKPNLKQDQREKLKAEWIKSMNGADDNGSSVIFTEQDIDFIPMESKTGDNIINGRKFENLNIAKIFNINPVFLFDDNSNTYNSLEQKTLSFLTTTLFPWIERFLQEFQRHLPKNQVIRFNKEYYMEIDQTSLGNYCKSMTQAGLLTINEARKKMSLPSVEGADTLLCPVNQMSLQRILNGENKNSINNQLTPSETNKNNEDKQ